MTSAKFILCTSRRHVDDIEAHSADRTGWFGVRCSQGRYEKLPEPPALKW
jgi:hypothetical protein